MSGTLRSRNKALSMTAASARIRKPAGSVLRMDMASVPRGVAVSVGRQVVAAKMWTSTPAPAAAAPLPQRAGARQSWHAQSWQRWVVLRYGWGCRGAMLHVLGLRWGPRCPWQLSLVARAAPQAGWSVPTAYS